MVVQRRRKRKGGFLFGTVVGLAAGLAGGTALLRRVATQNDDIEVTVEVDAAAEREAGLVQAAQQAPAAARERAQGSVEALKRRWREAVAEGKVAAAEREAELERQYARETKRITPPTPPSGSMDIQR
jgi:hypothetical protein